jgi:hypothetical protein
MEKSEKSKMRMDLLKRGFSQFLLVGILYAIIRDKEVLAYFLSLDTILTVLIFAVLGGLLYPLTTPMLAKSIRRFRKTVEEGEA